MTGRQAGNLLAVFNIGQRSAVAGAFKLAGYEGDLMTLQVDDPSERMFVLEPPDLAALRDVRVLEQIVGQVLGCKVAIFETRAGLDCVPFE